MYNIAVCDDDQNSIDILNKSIKDYFSKTIKQPIISNFQDGIKLISSLTTFKTYDIVFLDIIMPLMNGIEIAKEIRKYNENCLIIFLTSSPEFAIQSYEVQAFNYILKPIISDKFNLVMDKIIENLSKNVSDNIYVKNTDGFYYSINIRSIEYIEVLNHDIYFYYSKSFVKTRGKISDYENFFEKYHEFIRPHRSYIANMNFISKIGIHKIIMKSGHEVPLSRPYFQKLSDDFLKFKFSTE